MPIVAAPPPPPQPQPVAAPAPPPPAPPPPPPPEPVPEPVPEPEPVPAMETAAPPMESDPSDTPSAPDDVSPEVQEIRDILGMGDEESLGDGVPMESAPSEGSSGDSDAPDLGDSTEDLDDIFNAPGAEEDHQSVDEVMSDLDPEPIPDVFSAPSSFAKKKKKKSSGGMWFLIILILLAGIVGGAWFMRSTVIGFLPAAEPVYKMIDDLALFKPEPGKGITFSDIQFKKQSVGGVNALVIFGTLVNGTSGVVEMPNMKLDLLDGTGEVIQFTVGPPPAPSIGGGEKMQFSISMKNPAGDAAKFEVNWTSDPVEGHAPPPKADH